MANENKINFGLSQVHFAPYTETAGVITYETPIPIKGAVDITLDPRGELSEFYADNILYYVASSNQGYDITLNVALIPEEFSVKALGEEKETVDGVLTEIADAISKPFALMFQFEGDQKGTRHLLFNCTANRPSLGGTTKTDTTEPDTNELVLIASPMEQNKKLVVKTKTTADTPDATYNSWYTTVYQLPVGP